jgi:Domain of unknown function (DUF5658)
MLSRVLIGKNWGEINRAKMWLLAMTAILQAADVVTTNVVLGVPGASESNSIMAAAMETFGRYWWVPKVLVLPTVFYVLGRYHKLWPAIIVVALYSLVVAINIFNILVIAAARGL